MRKSNLDELPAELQLRIVFYLTPSGIRNLIINRALRPLCEQGLYESILIPRHSERSVRLLETFLARPDLALLVRHLSINLSWIWKYQDTRTPSALHPNPLHALSLARNLKSFAPCGVARWIWDPEMSAFRDAILRMKLTRLEIPLLWDPKTSDDEEVCFGWLASESDGEEEEEDWDGDLGQELRKVLQSQPCLEELALPTGDLAWETVDSLRTNLKESDIPNLSLTIGDWDKDVFSALEAASKSIKLSIRSFSIRVWYHGDERWWFWTNLDKALGLFPNSEFLSITINSMTTVKKMPSAQYYFAKVANHVYLCPALRSVEVGYETLYASKPGIFDVEAQTIDQFKAACPLLQSLVDPMGRLWTFRPQPRSSGGSCAHLVGKLRPEYYGHQNDLPARMGDNA
ncbi:hypothetical protein FRB90_005580 [Tulasnella sp. 427]|nr:hypothetical protein FRB90_005580 [Tulasnella sp. 427]